MAKRLCGSTVVLLVLFVFAFDCILKTVRPLSFIHSPYFIPLEQNLAAIRLPRFFAEAQNPNILLLGDSTLLHPIARCDDHFKGEPTRYDYLYQWNRVNNNPNALYFSNLLNKKLGLALKTENLGVAGAMTSDQHLILKNIVSSNKLPQLVIYFIAPRQLLDNQHSQIEQTPVYKVLANADSIQVLLKKDPKAEELRDCLLSMAWYYYKVKVDYRTMASLITAQISGHPLTLYQAMANTKSRENQAQKNIAIYDNTPDYTPKVNTLKDIQQYREAYNPPNYKLFEQQRAHLSSMLQLAQNKNLTVILVNMPLTAENKNLLPIESRQLYLSTIKSLCTKYGASFYDLDHQGLYRLSDFEDSCHMNRYGGEKLFACLVDKLSQDKIAIKSISKNTAQQFAGFKLPWL